MKLETSVWFFVAFYDWIISEIIPVGSFFWWLVLCFLRDGIHSDTCFFAQRSVFTDKFQHLYSWVMFHLEVVIWTFHLFTRQRELERFCGNLKSFLHCSWLLQNLLQLVVIYIETIDFLSRVLLWHFLGTNFSSWLTNLIIRETA